MLDSGVRLAAASLPVGVPVVVGLVIAVLRRRELPAVSAPAIAGLAVQLVVVLVSTFLVAATSFDAFGLAPETLLPLSSVLGFVVILLQVVSWTLLLMALFRRLPGAPAPSREDRTPTGRHALVDDRGDQVVAEAGTTFLPVGAGSRSGTATGPRPVTGPPPPPPGRPQGPPPGASPGPPQGPSQGPGQGPAPGLAPRTPPGSPPASPVGSPASSPLPSIPIPGTATAAASEHDTGRETGDAGDTGAESGDRLADTDTDTDTDTIQAYREPVPDARHGGGDAEDVGSPEVPGEQAGDETPVDEAPEDETPVYEAPDDAGSSSDTDASPGGETDDQDDPDDADDPDEGHHPGDVEGVADPVGSTGTAGDDASEQDAPAGEDVDTEPAADADREAAGDGTPEEPHDAPAPAAPSGGHPWFDPDGEAARTRPGPR